MVGNAWISQHGCLPMPKAPSLVPCMLFVEWRVPSCHTNAELVSHHQLLGPVPLHASERLFLVLAFRRLNPVYEVYAWHQSQTREDTVFSGSSYVPGHNNGCLKNDDADVLLAFLTGCFLYASFAAEGRVRPGHKCPEAARLVGR